MTRSVRQVATDHLEAVRSGDALAMAADYSPAAVLERAGDRHVGRAAIEAYFRSVPARLGDATVVFDHLDVAGETATFRWHLDGLPADADPIAGTDTCVIEDGAIVHQRVELDAADF